MTNIRMCGICLVVQDNGLQVEGAIKASLSIETWIDCTFFFWAKSNSTGTLVK